ncbi:hypothetical protein PYCCODRAFT_760469 [Trametes coccinea BRFM310]|uniref:Uncharacterized protein n=1 Tax=Trametes coccinea (strain BRFM310) TaxID=1353009 RepID=A0A1Y2J064_TRAC3|nr:hypothetical protein PYCCODRAFT_760469 [Trametes coccinea BRFM310]
MDALGNVDGKPELERGSPVHTQQLLASPFHILQAPDSLFSFLLLPPSSHHIHRRVCAFPSVGRTTRPPSPPGGPDVSQLQRHPLRFSTVPAQLPLPLHELAGCLSSHLLCNRVVIVLCLPLCSLVITQP